MKILLAERSEINGKSTLLVDAFALEKEIAFGIIVSYLSKYNLSF